MDNLREVEPKTGMPEVGMVGPYRIQEELGRGFSSVVYLAADPKRGRAVALKLLTFPTALPADLQADLTERFRREARAVAGLTHPSIVAVYDVGQAAGGQPYLVLERLRGQSLRQRLRSAGRLPMAEALPIALRVAEALDYAHGRGIIHRDVKPDNIFLSLAGIGESGETVPKLMDFGISRTLEDQEMTRDGLVVGSPAYMAPEQISGEPVDARTDVFSLAVTLAEMLTGAKPFEADTVPAVMRQILHSAPRLDGLDNPRLERVLRKAMANRPGQRYASAGEFAEALRRVLPLEMPAPSVTTQFVRMPPLAPARPVRDKGIGIARGLWVGAAALVGLALGAGTVRLWPPAPVRPASVAVRIVPAYPARPVQRAEPVTAAARTPALPPSLPSHPAILSASLPYTAAVAEKTPKTTSKTAPKTTLKTAPKPIAPPPHRAAPRRLRLAPSPPVVVHLASSDILPPVVRVSDSRQEMTHQEIVRPETARQEIMPDGPPRLLSSPAPAVPFGMTPSGEQVKLHLHINKLGQVTDADVLESSGSEELDNAALDAVGGWTYAPAVRGGRPLRGETDAAVTFPAP